MTSPGSLPDLSATFGAIDIYLFDQLLRGTITRADRILDAGCGSGRNLVYFLREGYDVAAVDPDPDAVAGVRGLVADLAPSLPPDRVRQEAIEHCSFAPGWATVVISSAVLHFARDEAHFDAMLEGVWRCLAPGGLFFCRLASTVALEREVGRAGCRSRLPDGSTRFLVDEGMLLDRTRRLGGRLADPLRTTVVHGQRSMTTWVLRK